MEGYLSHHLKIAGLNHCPFDEQAITAIHQGSGGLFRKATPLARGALLAARWSQPSMCAWPPPNCSDVRSNPMKSEEHILYAGKLLNLVQQMEQTLKDYCRLLTSQDDGHWLENERDDEEPF